MDTSPPSYHSLVDLQVRKQLVVVIPCGEAEVWQAPWFMKLQVPPRPLEHELLLLLLSLANHSFNKITLRCFVLHTPQIFELQRATNIQLMVTCWLGARFGFLGSPYERDCYLRAPLGSQTSNPIHTRLGFGFTALLVCLRQLDGWMLGLCGIW